MITTDLTPKHCQSGCIHLRTCSLTHAASTWPSATCTLPCFLGLIGDKQKTAVLGEWLTFISEVTEYKKHSVVCFGSVMCLKTASHCAMFSFTKCFCLLRLRPDLCLPLQETLRSEVFFKLQISSKDKTDYKWNIYHGNYMKCQ